MESDMKGFCGLWAEMRRRWTSGEPMDPHIRADIGLPAPEREALHVSPLVKAWLR